MNDSLSSKIGILLRAALLPSLVLLTSATGVAANDRSEQAAVHFSRGVELVRLGDLESAAAEFEAANELRPHPTVLYNLGQTYASLGRSVDVVRTLKIYLAESPELPPGRQREVEALIAFHSKRIGKLQVSLDPPDAELLLDGKATTIVDGTPLEVTAGTHSLLVRKPGYQPVVIAPLVRPNDTSPIKVVLEPANPAARAWLFIDCSVLGAATYLDGRMVGYTPWLKPLDVEVGSHTLAFSRPGYEAVPTSLDVRGALAASCQVRPSPRLDSTNGAHLRLVGLPSQAKISVDSEPYHGEVLPPGSHALLVESPGYESRSTTVHLPLGRTTVVDLELTPTPAQRRLLAEQSRSRRRTYALVGGGVGAALGGVAGVLYALNAQRYADYSAESKKLSGRISARPASSDDVKQLNELTERAASIQRVDYLALTTAALGAALLGGAVVLYASAAPMDAPNRAGMLGLRGNVW